MFLQSKAISEKKLGKKHADFWAALLNLAVLYNKMGEFNKSESLYLETKAIYEKLMIKIVKHFKNYLNNLEDCILINFNMTKLKFYSELKVIYDKAISEIT
ncbi:MAG: tetratricopeptide repeat protein [Saprospiraceae bacterium]|nr:tetratricopeptide repeat protein [Candidatus Vicinibacter affinis]